MCTDVALRIAAAAAWGTAVVVGAWAWQRAAVPVVAAYKLGRLDARG